MPQRSLNVSLYWITAWVVSLALAGTLSGATVRGQDPPPRNSTPRILNLQAIPAAIDADGTSSLVTFTLDDTDGDYLSWSITLSATGDDDVDGAGNLDVASGTDAGGTTVQVTYSAPRNWNPMTVLLTVNATDDHGGWAASQWIAISVQPGGAGREL